MVSRNFSVALTNIVVRTTQAEQQNLMPSIIPPSLPPSLQSMPTNQLSQTELHLAAARGDIPTITAFLRSHPGLLLTLALT